MKIMHAPTTFVIRNITSCKVIDGVNDRSHKIRNSNVKKNIPHLSGRFVKAAGGDEEWEEWSISDKAESWLPIQLCNW